MEGGEDSLGTNMDPGQRTMLIGDYGTSSGLETSNFKDDNEALYARPLCEYWIFDLD